MSSERNASFWYVSSISHDEPFGERLRMANEALVREAIFGTGIFVFSAQTLSTLSKRLAR